MSYEMVAEGNSFKLYTPYDKAFVARFRSEIPSSAKKYIENPITGRFDHWLIANQYADQVKQLCTEVYGYPPDQVGLITKTQVVNEYTVLLEYMGLPRDRGGEVTASGWYNDGWNLIFPLLALENWFNFKGEIPKEEQTYYEILSIKKNVSGAELKKAYRKAARAWHPDVCSEPDAKEMFQDIQQAYEILSDPQARRKYDACLVEANNLPPSRKRYESKPSIGWRPPYRCGNIKVRGIESAGRIIVEEILAWDDVINLEGKTMVTSWDMSIETFRTEWV